jgi:protein involved in polysaccharide export with SLBB domain
MNWVRKIFVSMRSGALAIAALLILAGCETLNGPGPSESADKGYVPGQDTIRPGEQLTIEFLDISPPQKIEQTVQEDGTITLLLGLTVKASEKKAGQLRAEIEKLYVPKYYRRLTVNIRQGDRYYYVGGEVKNPSQRPYTGEMTVMRAIKSAGDFTDYADKKNVEVIRTNGKKQKVNAIKAIKDPKLDLPVYPGDTVHVPQSWK